MGNFLKWFDKKNSDVREPSLGREILFSGAKKGGKELAQELFKK